jgi:hypothetical protein
MANDILQRIQQSNGALVGGTALPGQGPDLGAGLNNPPLPQQLTNNSDTVNTSNVSGQSGSPGIFTTTTQQSQYNFTDPSTTNTSASSALLNSTNINSLGSLPGSLFGIDAGLGQYGITDISKSGQSSSNVAPKPNILDSYPTYTYRFALMMVPPGTYNDTIDNPSSFVPSNVLIASAGLFGNNTFTRNALFNDDFYFENVEIETIIGLNSETRGSNAISLKFEILEPYGCTLLNRLIDATAGISGSNYLSMPYIMQIDFVGYDNNGSPVNPIPGTTKVIPFQLIAMKIKYSERGTVYSVEGIPVNHSSYSDTQVRIPANFEISATKVNDFFNAIAQQTNTSTNRQESVATSQAQRVQQLQGATTDNQIQAYVNAQNSSAAANTDISSQSTIVTGVKDALNTWHANLVNNNNQMVKDEYEFIFDPDIAKATLTIPKRTDPKNTQFLSDTDRKDYKVKGAQSSQNQGAYTLDYNTNTFRINAGTSIIDLINNVLRNSSYMTTQITDSNAGNQASQVPGSATQNKNVPYQHWRITTEVKLLDYDKVRNTYAKKITYHINKYTMYNIRYPFAPQGKATKYVKDYQWLFTGKNSNIIDLDLTFEGLFYTAVTAYPAQAQSTSMQSVTDNNTKQTENILIPPQGNVSPTRNQPVSGIMSAMAPGYAAKDTLTTLAADLHANLLSTSQSDMINVTMTIVGDPDFIKQDDILYIGDQVTNMSGSIPMDNGEVDVKITFNSAGDYDMNTGLLSKTTYQATNNVFTGLYRVMTVVSSFSGGQFTQKLSMIRLPNQTNDYTANKNTNSGTTSERSDSGYDTPTGTNSTQINANVLAGASVSNGIISSPNNLVADATDRIPIVNSYQAIGQFTNQFSSGSGGNGTQPNPDINILVTGTNTSQ